MAHAGDQWLSGDDLRSELENRSGGRCKQRWPGRTWCSWWSLRAAVRICAANITSVASPRYPEYSLPVLRISHGSAHDALLVEVPMTARPRILCIGHHLDVTAEELRAAGFDVMMATNAQSAQALIHLYPPAAIVAHLDSGREIHQKHPRIPAVLVSANVGRKLPPQSATNKAGHRDASSF